MGEKASPIAVVIDDEGSLRKFLRVALEKEGYEVYESESGRTGLAEIAYRRPDVILLDLGLPDMDGLEVLRSLREWNRVPVLVLSVRQEVDDKVAALDAGADDYLTKPFHAAELAARLRVLRRHTQEKDEPVLQIGPLEIDFVARQVRVHRREIHLTATEYALLRVLARHRGKVVLHRQVLCEVWGPGASEQAQYLRVYVNHLRKKLREAAPDTDFIQTEPGIGYRFRDA
jgi:two-component system KDP operon response regulator KdpE